MLAWIAGPPSPVTSDRSDPVTVVITPAESTLRTRTFTGKQGGANKPPPGQSSPASPINKLPAPSTASDRGPPSWADVARPRSPLKPAEPVPATVLNPPPGAILYTLCAIASAMKTFPAPSAAKPPGAVNEPPPAG